MNTIVFDVDAIKAVSTTSFVTFFKYSLIWKSKIEQIRCDILPIVLGQMKKFQILRFRSSSTFTV